MNLAVVSRAAAGLMRFLTHALDGEPPRVVIGFDARHRSRDFAYASASIIAGAGGQVSVFDQHCPTPVLAYAVRHLDADAGIMVTASHNPAHDNGYKVYLGGRMAPEEGQGVQIVTPDDEHIATAIAAIDTVADLPKTHSYRVVGQDLIDSYIDAVTKLPGSPSRRDLAIVYTPLHGVGGEVALEVFARAGFNNVHPVPAQLDPDPDFPTVAFPNPEEPGALDLAFETATAIDADVVIAHDPDADRVAVGVPSVGGWRQLSGDEVGALLGEMIAAHAPAGGVFASSVVSCRLLGLIACSYGLNHRSTLTGFKWISRTPGLVYGYEEALGYCVAPAIVRDKDGISAGLLMAILAALAHSTGASLLDRLDDLALRHGLYSTKALSFRVDDVDVIEKLMTRLRTTGVPELAGSPVISSQDLSCGEELPPTDAIIFTSSHNDRVIVRPSGTEPKLKCYLEVVIPVSDRGYLDEAKRLAKQRLRSLAEQITDTLGLPPC